MQFDFGMATMRFVSLNQTVPCPTPYLFGLWSCRRATSVPSESLSGGGVNISTASPDGKPQMTNPENTHKGLLNRL